MKYKIFTNDREESPEGIALYSCFRTVEAVSASAARKFCPPAFDAPNFAPARAIPASVSEQSNEEKQWLAKHVGDAK